jgi:branched-chain amino acid transport system permease protein
LAGRGFRPALRHRCRGRSSGITHLFVLAIVVLLLLPVEGLVRDRTGRPWIAIRDMDLAAEIIGIRPLRAKLFAFVLGLVHCGIGVQVGLHLYKRGRGQRL